MLQRDRLTRLARVTGELVTADTVEAVSKTVVAHGAHAVGAQMAIMTLLSADCEGMRLVGLSGGRPGVAEAWATYPVTVRTPATDAVRTGRRVVVTGFDEINEKYPDLEDFVRGNHTLMGLPLSVGARIVGAIGLAFAGERPLDSVELEFLDILADTTAQALDRIAAQDIAARQSAKLVFLADASRKLASSLDYEATLTSVARLAVPTFADWCAIDVLDDGRLRRVAVQHVDPGKVRLAHELNERYPPDPHTPHGAWHVIRTGRSELIADITDDMLVAGARGDLDLLRVSRDLHLRSALTVPLVARGRVLGVLSWVAAESERRFTLEDLALAEDLAERAAMALDNADLHSQTLTAAVQLQHAVLPAAIPSPHGWEIAHHYSPAGRTGVGGDFYDVIELDDSRLALFVGDVMGRGVTAAAAMAQIRAAVRAYSALDPSPTSVLRRLDQLYTRFPTDQLVTLVYMVADPARDLLLVGNAGHPPPVMVREHGPAEQLPHADGSPLGVEPQERRQVAVRFEPTDTIVAFTDGLIERRDEDITTGQARLLQAVATINGRDLDAALTDAVNALRDPSRDDDVAVLAARRLTVTDPTTADTQPRRRGGRPGQRSRRSAID